MTSAAYPPSNSRVPPVASMTMKARFEDYGAVLQRNTIANFIVSFAFLELLDQGNKIRQAEAKATAADNSSTAKMRNWVSSQIVTTTSIGAYSRDHAPFIYNASKAATTHMMRHLATYLIPYGIRSNVLAPGFWHTEMTDDVARSVAFTGGEIPKSMIPEQRFGTE